MLELNSFSGVLYITAVKKDNLVSTTVLCGVSGSGVYNAIMSKEYFKFVTNCWRFDDRVTKNTRKALDEFAHLREIWDNFTDKCADMYLPSVNSTIDEEIVGEVSLVVRFLL